jgi:hypothetical protein
MRLSDPGDLTIEEVIRMDKPCGPEHIYREHLANYTNLVMSPVVHAHYTPSELEKALRREELKVARAYIAWKYPRFPPDRAEQNGAFVGVGSLPPGGALEYSIDHWFLDPPLRSFKTVFVRSPQ